MGGGGGGGGGFLGGAGGLGADFFSLGVTTPSSGLYEPPKIVSVVDSLLVSV